MGVSRWTEWRTRLDAAHAGLVRDWTLPDPEAAATAAAPCASGEARRRAEEASRVVTPATSFVEGDPEWARQDANLPPGAGLLCVEMLSGHSVSAALTRRPGSCPTRAPRSS
jgi:hypothetical protein